MSTKHVLAISHNSLGGGDSIDVTAKEKSDGWELEIEESSSYEYVKPSGKIQQLNVDTLEKFIDGIEIEDEPLSGAWSSDFSMQIGLQTESWTKASVKRRPSLLRWSQMIFHT